MTQLRVHPARERLCGRLRILVPMLANAHEIRQTLAFIERAKAELRAQKIAMTTTSRSVAWVKSRLRCFRSGTSSSTSTFFRSAPTILIQYTLAIDRTDDAVAHMYDPCIRPFSKLIAQAIRTANKANTPIAVCGEMARRIAPHTAAARFRAAQFFDASGTTAHHQAARAHLQHRRLRSSRQPHPAHRRPDKIASSLARLNAVASDRARSFAPHSQITKYTCNSSPPLAGCERSLSTVLHRRIAPTDGVMQRNQGQPWGKFFDPLPHRIRRHRVRCIDLRCGHRWPRSRRLCQRDSTGATAEIVSERVTITAPPGVIPPRRPATPSSLPRFAPETGFLRHRSSSGWR